MSGSEVAQNEEIFFNILDEPWILVRNKQGKVEELSVLETFRRAHELEIINGELPTQDVAILRFLLAILYSVFTRVDENGAFSLLQDLGIEEQHDEALRRWKALWDAPTLPIEPIEYYLGLNHDCFWLNHPKRPFYQVAGLKSSNEQKDTSQMVADIPPRAERRFFTLRNGIGATTLSYSEAVRWLITLHAWDYAGKKAVTTDANGNRGSENGGGTGWLGKLGVLYVQEPCLSKTLLMNLVLLNEKEELLAFGLPIWEDQQENPRTARKLEKQPMGYIELLTYQSRRVCLTAQDKKVIGVTVSYGDVFDKENTFIEQMTAWQKNSKFETAPTYYPKIHNPEKKLWRNLTSLLPQASDSEQKTIVAGVIRWGQILKSNNLIREDRLTVSAVGAEYGTANSVIEEVISDGLTINTGLLTPLNRIWTRRIILALKKTDECISKLGKLAQQFAKASGSSNGNSRYSDASALAYYTFDNKFRLWLASINPDTDSLDSRIIEWQEEVAKVMTDIGNDLYEALNSQAIIGRTDKKNNKIIAAPVYFADFRRSINKIMKSWREEKSDEQS